MQHKGIYVVMDPEYMLPVEPPSALLLFSPEVGGGGKTFFWRSVNRKQTEAMRHGTWSSLGAVVTRVLGTVCLLLD